ncbi:hypothetical protein ACSFV5_00260 [Acinetobacter sp. HC8-3S]
MLSLSCTWLRVVVEPLFVDETSPPTPPNALPRTLTGVVNGAVTSTSSPFPLPIP